MITVEEITDHVIEAVKVGRDEHTELSHDERQTFTIRVIEAILDIAENKSKGFPLHKGVIAVVLIGIVRVFVRLYPEIIEVAKNHPLRK